MSLTDDILTSIDIVDIVSQYVNLKKSGRNFVGLCPFHSEKTPSFVVSPDKQIFKCFWCWKGWNAITFIKEIENVDFYDAIKILADKAWIDLKKYKTNFTQNEQELNLKEQLFAVNKAALNFFHKQIFQNSEAYNYLHQQRQIPENLITKYKLGYAPADSQILIKYLKEKWFTDEIILKAGLAKKTSSGSIYSFFTNRIIFPIFNHLWEPVAFSGRIFHGETNTWKYINTPETIIYHKSNILYNYHNAKKTKQDYIIVCEGYMDVIWLDRLGFDNAVATCWTALTTNHILALKRITPNVVFAFDSDQAWQQASLRWLKVALENWVYPKIFQIQWWKDFDELANQWVSDLKILENSQDGVSFFMKKLLENYKNLWPIEKQEKLEQVFDILRQISNYSIFWDYLEQLGKIINQDPNILYQQFKNKKTYRKPQQANTDNSNKFIIPALFYNEFFKNLKVDWFEKYIELVLEILDFLPENNLIKKVLTGEISSQEQEKLLEKQLRWEQTLHWRTTDKIQNKILQEVKIYFIKLLTDLIKNPAIKPEDKEVLMRKLIEVRR